MSDPGLVFVLNILPHYRSGVLREVCSQSRVGVLIAGGTADRRVRDIPGIDPAGLPIVKLTNYHLGPFVWQAGVLSLVREHRAAAFVFTGDWKILSTWVALVLARGLRARTFLWTIGWHRAVGDNLGKRCVRKLFYRLSVGLLVYGNRAKKIGIAQGYPGKRIRVVGNSYPLTERYPPKTGELETDIIYVGRLTPTKKIHVIIDALASIAADSRPRLKVVGVGPELAKLRSAAQVAGVDVEFLGEIHGEKELARVYRSAKVTMIPGAVGLTAIQSIGFGVPVITHGDMDRQMPEVEAIQSGSTGQVLVSDDAMTFATSIAYWTAMPADEYRSRSEECLAEYGRNWTPSRHATRILAAIAELSDESAPRTDSSLHLMRLTSDGGTSRSVTRGRRKFARGSLRRPR